MDKCYSESLKFMFICPEIMFFTKIARIKRLIAKASKVTFRRKFNSFKNSFDILRFIGWIYFSLFPVLPMIPFYMIAIIDKKFEIFYFVICSNMVFVVNSFSLLKLSAKMLFHYINMFQNSFPIYIYSNISMRSKGRLAFF